MSTSHGNSNPVKGEWECYECGWIIAGWGDKPPQGKCPDCGAPAEESYRFFVYGDDDEDGVDDISDYYTDDDGADT